MKPRQQTDTAPSNVFKTMSPGAKTTKTKMSRWDYAKHKSLCIVKGHHQPNEKTAASSAPSWRPIACPVLTDPTETLS